MVSDSIHLHSNGRDTKAHLEIGFKFMPKGYKPEYRTSQIGLGNGVDIDIKGMDANQELHAYAVLTEHTKILSFEPHLHAPGARMCLEASWGYTVETINCVGYDHNWVRGYDYDDDHAPLLPKGTVLHIVGYMNNSPTNKNVPDPRNWQGSGNRSVANMFIDLGNRVSLTDQQFLDELKARKEKLGLSRSDVMIGCPFCNLPLPDKIPAPATPATTRSAATAAVTPAIRSRTMIRRVLGVAMAVALGAAVTAPAQNLTYTKGQNVSPAYEGWEEDSAGRKFFVFGYMNRNWEEELDVPVGPDNRFTTGAADQGQPTHFLPRRNRFIFRVPVPAGFTEKDELVWSSDHQGQDRDGLREPPPRLPDRRRREGVRDRGPRRRQQQSRSARQHPAGARGAGTAAGRGRASASRCRSWSPCATTASPGPGQSAPARRWTTAGRRWLPPARRPRPPRSRRCGPAG